MSSSLGALHSSDRRTWYEFSSSWGFSSKLGPVFSQLRDLGLRDSGGASTGHFPMLQGVSCGSSTPNPHLPGAASVLGARKRPISERCGGKMHIDASGDALRRLAGAALLTVCPLLSSTALQRATCGILALSGPSRPNSSNFTRIGAQCELSHKRWAGPSAMYLIFTKVCPDSRPHGGFCC